MKFRTVLALIVVSLALVLGVIGCSDQSDDADTEQQGKDEGLGTVTSVDSYTVSYTRPLEGSVNEMSQLYRDLGKFDEFSEFNASFQSYVGDITPQLQSYGFFTDIIEPLPEELEEEREVNSFSAYNDRHTIGYTIYVSKGGYQSISQYNIIYKTEFKEADDEELTEIIDRIWRYLGVNVSYEDIMKSISEVRNRADEKSSYSVVLTDETETRKVTVTVIDYATDYESWAIDANIVISTGEEPAAYLEAE